MFKSEVLKVLNEFFIIPGLKIFFSTICVNAYEITNAKSLKIVRTSKKKTVDFP